LAFLCPFSDAQNSYQPFAPGRFLSNGHLGLTANQLSAAHRVEDSAHTGLRHQKRRVFRRSLADFTSSQADFAREFPNQGVAAHCCDFQNIISGSSEWSPKIPSDSVAVCGLRPHFSQCPDLVNQAADND
jgi:hypothetical protein